MYDFGRGRDSEVSGSARPNPTGVTDDGWRCQIIQTTDQEETLCGDNRLISGKTKRWHGCAVQEPFPFRSNAMTPEPSEFREPIRRFRRFTYGEMLARAEFELEQALTVRY